MVQKWKGKWKNHNNNKYIFDAQLTVVSLLLAGPLGSNHDDEWVGVRLIVAKEHEDKPLAIDVKDSMAIIFI